MAISMDFGISHLAAVLVAIGIIHLLGNALYNVFFHPLRSFPGPFTHSASRIPYAWKLMKGTLEYDMLALHERYGDVVRVAPNELAFSHPDAWKDIMGHRAGGEELGKSKHFYCAVVNTPTSIMNADRVEHSMLRRQLAHGFSEKSMRDQEPLIARYIDLLIQRLHENCAGGSEAVNLGAWYNYATFDIIGDLAFGEPFGCLRDSSYHSFVRFIVDSAWAGCIFLSIGFFPWLKKLIIALLSNSSARKYGERQRKLSMAKLRRRMKPGNHRPDLVEALLQKKDVLSIPLETLEATCNILIIGGSETTATLLSGVTYLLLTNPATLQRLTEEVRTTFKSEDEINIFSVHELNYMLACLDEAMRVYPPVPIGMPRTVPKDGCQILGRFVPGNTIVAVHQWAAYHNKEHFTDPFSFHPERFLGDPRFANDDRDILQPFHVGPRACIGRNLAYTEMRLILARVIFNFDMKIADDSTEWMQHQKIYLMWEKKPLNVYLIPRVT